MVLQHILVGFILVVIPLMSVYDLRKLKASHDPNGKIKLYFKSTLLLWVMTGLIFYVSPPGELFYYPYSIEFNLLIKLVLIFCFLFFIFTTITPLFLLKNKNFRENLAGNFKERQFILPVTKLEKWLFVFVAISVGICEEIIYRSYLVNYLHGAPWGFTELTSVIVAGILFGLVHFHQGANGVFSAMIVGFLMGYLFILTGNLLLPMIIHAVYDMKLLLIGRVAFKTAGH